MKRMLVMLLCVLFPLALFAGQDGYKVKYDGGSLSSVKTGTELKLLIQGKEIHLVNKSGDVQVIPASSVTEISYGQDVHRRVGAAIGIAVVSFGVGALIG